MSSDAFPCAAGCRQPPTGAAAQPTPGSTVQVAEQPSPGSWLPSSHVSPQPVCVMPSPHTLESPLHVPATQTSDTVHALASSQPVPSGTSPSAGHTGPAPVHVSAASH